MEWGFHARFPRNYGIRGEALEIKSEKIGIVTLPLPIFIKETNNEYLLAG